MGTISDKLMRIINTKEDIRQALISKGYHIPTSIPFKEYAKMILDLPCKVDDFPKLPGDVTRWHFGGLTNEMMAAMDDPRIEDADHKGRFLSFKNFAWKGMSGVGGYEMNFNLWRNNVSSIPDFSMSTTTTSVSVSVGNSTYNNNLIYIHISNWDINKNHWLKVTSTYEDGDLAFIFYNDSNTKKIGLPANGYVNILAYPEFKGSYMYISTISNKQGSFTIEQLPLYPGALVFDGVDDYGTCDNFPILTKEKGYTVVALRQYLVEKSTAYLTANGDSISNASFIFEGNNYRDTWNFGKATTIQASRILATQTSKQYDGVKLNIGTNAEGSNLLQVGKWSKSYSNVAIWELVFLDHDATEEELTKIKDYFVKTYPWLFPDQAWTVVGKTNEDEDRATIANITGNGNNLVLSNFGFIEGSGYNEEGEYAGYLVTDGVDDIASSNTIIYEADFTFIGEWKFIQKDDTVAGINSPSHLYIQNRYNRGATVMINSTFENKKNITDYMTFKAITSKGKAYDENWNEVDLLYGDGNKGPSGVNIGGQGGTQFCHMIFKNMALYMNKVFSKDDCIKAYNYLQTLKAK